MENKFIRIVQPLTLMFLVVLDIAAAALFILAIIRVKNAATFHAVASLIINIVVLVTAVISTIQSLKSGVKLNDESLEFTGLDNDNTYNYSDIKKAEAVKDTKASFKKNYVERYSSIILYLNDDSVATIELGYTSKKRLNQILDEINKRCD